MEGSGDRLVGLSDLGSAILSAAREALHGLEVAADAFGFDGAVGDAHAVAAAGDVREQQAHR